MDYSDRCSELKKLVAKPRSEKGLGLVIVTAKWGTQFIVEYRKDWNVPIAEEFSSNRLLSILRREVKSAHCCLILSFFQQTGDS